MKIHAETLWQVDFFSKLIVTPMGLRQAFAMAFIHIGTRRIFVTPATLKPDAEWMKSQAHAFLEFAAREDLKCGTLMRDRDGKYTQDFLAVFTDRGVADKPVGPRAPNLNAFVERWVQSVKHEALNHFIVFGLAHFDHIVREFVNYYHLRRPHQGVGNRLIIAKANQQGPSITSVDQVRCESRLAGLLKSYSRAA